MEDFRDDKELSDLFRQTLGNAEVSPSPSLSSNLMRKVGMREFLRFNPARFNIWYAGAAVAAAGTTLAVILTLSPGKAKKEIQVLQPVEIYHGSVDNDVTKDLSAPSTNTGEKRQTAENVKKNGAPTVYEPSSDRKTAAVSSGAGTNQTAEAQKINTIPATAVLQDGMDNLTLRTNNKSQSLIEASVTEGCSPLRVMFRSLTGAADSCLWYFGDGGYSSLKNPVWIYDDAGEYKVVLQVISSGLKSVYSAVISVHPKPLAKFEITPENAVLPRDEVNFRNYSEGAVKYRWDFGDNMSSELFEPRHSYRKYGSYNVQLIATSENGCSDSVVINNAFSSSGNYIEFPNAFIPNPTGPSGGYYSPKSDEVSQIFHPVFSGVTDYQLRIFSKRGILIFETNDINYGWDGYYKGQMCDPGVYVWKVRGYFINNGQFTKVGDVTLLRN